MQYTACMAKGSLDILQECSKYHFRPHFNLPIGTQHFNTGLFQRTISRLTHRTFQYRSISAYYFRVTAKVYTHTPLNLYHTILYHIKLLIQNQIMYILNIITYYKQVNVIYEYISEKKKTMSNVIKVTRKTHCKRKIIIKCHI